MGEEPMEKVCRLLDLGTREYAQTLQLQRDLVQRRYRQEIPDTLILVEHEPVLTIGRAGSKSNILVPQEVLAREGISVYEVERGGDITYHGPGQLVGYPILDLDQHQRDLHWVLRSYEEVLIRCLQDDFGIPARRIKGYPGVWVGDKKIAAIGVAVSKWVTYHGFAFNVEPQMEHFRLINPCGITDKGVTSLAQLLGRSISLAEVKEPLLKHFADVFGYSKVVFHITPDQYHSTGLAPEKER